MAAFPGLIPGSAQIKAQSRVYDLKSRLDWGEPALTIIDVRDRETFNANHIMGAISIPASELVRSALNCLEFERDIYLYSDSDEETATAAAQLREAGYQHVAELTGGMAAWKAAGYPLESITTTA